MKPEDLRINALVWCENEYFTIVEISDRLIGIKSEDGDFHVACKYLHPILLTEDILLGCDGITKNKHFVNRYNYEDSNLYFSIEDGDWDNPCLDVFMGGTYLTCIEYVHELQDIIKVLMKQNLKVNLC